MLDELITNLETLSDEIQSKVLPENIREGIKLFNVDGALISTDTSDSSAVAEDIIRGKTAYINGGKVVGTLYVKCRTFATIEEMEAQSDVLDEDTYGVVYGTTYVGTYRLDNGTWTQIGDSTQEQQIMDVLNEIADTTDQYEGTGGTDEEISAVLDQILEGGSV